MTTSTLNKTSSTLDRHEMLRNKFKLPSASEKAECIEYLMEGMDMTSRDLKFYKTMLDILNSQQKLETHVVEGEVALLSGVLKQIAHENFSEKEGGENE